MYNVFEHIDMLFMGIQYHPYTGIPTQFLGSDFGVLGHLWSQNDVIMRRVEADSHLKLLPTSILDIYKTFNLIDMMYMCIWAQPYIDIPTLLGSDFGVLGHLWSQNDVIMSWLRLIATSNFFPHPHWTCKKCLSTLILSLLAYRSSLTQFYPQ
jgi:hypothetical protein